jgi:Ribonuclease G/E
MSVRVRGIYTTALTQLLAEAGLDVVQASGPIEARFDADFPVERAAATVETTDDRQGVGVSGDREAVERVVALLADVGRDTLSWADPLPERAVYAGEVTGTLGGGAVVDCGDGEGFLPYSNVDDRVETGDRVRVQVVEGAAPWTDGRPVLDTTVAVRGDLLTLVRGGSTSTTASGPAMLDVISADPRDGWGVSWEAESDDAEFGALADAVNAANERAAAIDGSLAAADPAADAAPGRSHDGGATVWVWFGRESRFALDDERRAVTTTMAGHHRVKAGSESASAAVDYVEALCEHPGADGDIDFPFAVTARQFGPQAGGSLTLGHGKPDGRLITLGRADVQSVDADGTVTVKREMAAGGEYDALGVPKEAGDIAETKLKEGRWWYPTTYRDRGDNSKGTYVNVCTPVEIFPDTARYVDLHVDVVKHADGTVERVDDDELDAAVAAGEVPAELADRARGVAAAVKNALD